MVAVPFGKEIIVNATTSGNQYRPVVAASPGGGFTIAWQDASGLGSVDLSDDVRFARYSGRFAAALAAIDAGDHDLVSSPVRDSVHNIWFEFHEDLLRTLGKARVE